MGDEWLVDKQIDVDIEQLQDFAKAIRAELDENFKPSFERGVRPMLAVQAPFGAGGMEEGRFFRSRHEDSRLAVGKMMMDAMKGLVALSVAASSIAGEYLTGDALAQAANDDVFDAFTGNDKSKMISDITQPEASGQVSDSELPEQAKDPGAALGDTGAANAMYEESTIAAGTTGEYTIPGDAQGLNDPSLDVQTSSDH